MREIKKDFPIFSHYPHTYLDTAATAHKPQVVIDAVSQTYSETYGSVHRGLYDLSVRASDGFEQARHCVSDFIHANETGSVVFTGGTTDGINLVARGVKNLLTPGSNLVITRMEHHANFVPWQVVARETGTELRIINLTPMGDLDMRHAEQLIDRDTKIVSVAHISNLLGAVNDVKTITDLARKYHALSLVDAAQSIGHMSVDVRELGCDFLAFSGHKMYGPTGIGVLYVRSECLEMLEPFRYGGGMVREVKDEGTTYRSGPAGFEGGTPNLAGVMGLAAAIRYLQRLGFDYIQAHSRRLTEKLVDMFKEDEIKVVGNPRSRLGSVSFLVDDIHPHDVASILAGDRICVRGGHHCAMPLLRDLAIPATTRASIGIYNGEEDIHTLRQSLVKVRRVFS